MKIRIADLPTGTTHDDIRELLENSGDIETIELVEEGDSDNPVAIVDFASDAAAEGAVLVLNGRNWNNATLRADKLLY